jgi:hypothetical protein
MTTEQVEQIEAPMPVSDQVGQEDAQQDQLPVGDAAPEQPVVASPAVGAAPAASEGPPVGGQPAQPPSDPRYSPAQLQQMQQDAAEYQTVQIRAALQTQATAYKEQLEGQGYLPEQAEQAAAEYMNSQERQASLMQQADAYGRHLQEKQMAVEHFVKKYNLGIDDMGALRRYEDPRAMDEAAKKMSADRERDTELARLKQAQVPAQSFDNSQGNPQVAADEGGWLDRYNAGDRSSSAQSAARKAAGLG